MYYLIYIYKTICYIKAMQFTWNTFFNQFPAGHICTIASYSYLYSQAFMIGVSVRTLWCSLLHFNSGLTSWVKSGSLCLVLGWFYDWWLIVIDEQEISRFLCVLILCFETIYIKYILNIYCKISGAVLRIIFFIISKAGLYIRRNKITISHVSVYRMYSIVSTTLQINWMHWPLGTLDEKRWEAAKQLGGLGSWFGLNVS